MGLLDIFKSDSDNVRRSHVKNLISIAMADGQLDSGEWDLLVAISRVMGMSEEEILSIKENPQKVQFTPPKKYEDKIQQIQDLVAVMTIDESINQDELALCKKIALKLNLLPQIVDDIVSDVFQPNPAAAKDTE